MTSYNHGWLPRDDTQSWHVGGVDIDPATRTRREEYNWVLDTITEEGYSVLDAAAGYVPTWHELPRMLAARNYDIIALDFDKRSLDMPYIQYVTRMLGDITSLPFADKSFDSVVCISVLEHLEPLHGRAAASELIRVARRQILITADWGHWIPQLFGCLNGPTDATPAEPRLDPPVYFMEMQL